jgi:outer membrane lipoprotein-sorting protein
VHRRSLIIIAIVALLVVTGVTVGVVESQAQGEPLLTTITPTQLLANVAQHAGDVKSISGDVTWKNDLLGLSMLSFGGQGTGDFTALLTGGSGRVWVQAGKVRFEIQGTTGDTTLIGDSSSVWVYAAGANTATEYTLPARATTQNGVESTTTAQLSQTTVTDPVAAINGFIQKLAPDATLAVSESVKVAGQSCYVLTLTPKATNTVFGSVQVAIDSKTFVPLSISVYSKGTADPVLKAGFTSVSYSTVADSIFAFTPPATAKVEHKTLTLPAGLTGSAGMTGQKDAVATTVAEQTPLTLAEAATQAGFTPLAAQTTDPALAFAGASVIPAQQLDLQSLLAKLQSSGLGSGIFGSDTSTTASGAQLPTSSPPETLPSSLTSGPVTLGPTVIQRYGQGFGTVVLVEAKVPTDVTAQLEQTLASVPLISRTTAGGVTIYQLGTSLGSIALWDKDGMVLIAAGSVSQTDLGGFISSVR